eukprot:c4765_g1_i1.p1 GENE.c4765_g1_i1~~c4765_g1_i1.p1  ORF type:complete len:1389 (+),score=277.83 c4765_g1_i1:44-4210(+)
MQQWARANFVPCIAVQCTPAAEAICAKNGMTFAQTLSPFSTVPDVNYQMRVAVDKVAVVSDFKLRFVMLSMVEAKKRSEICSALDHAVQEHAPRESVSWPFASIHDPSMFLQNAGSKDLTPWFTAFSETLMEQLRGGDCEALDYPLAVINVISAKDNDPVTTLTNLSSLSALPSVFTVGLADPKLLRYQVILHDNSDPTHLLEKSESVLQDAKKTFGSSGCRLVRLNSSTSEPASGPRKTHPPPWDAIPLSSASARSFLSVEDARTLSQLVAGFVNERLLKFLEEKLQRVSEQVQARKGLKNQLRSWWKRGNQDSNSKESEVTSTESSARAREGFGHDSPLGQQRILADLLMVVGDYEGAAAQYRHAAEEFKAEKAYRHCAAANEMLAVATAVHATQKPAQYAAVAAQVAMRVKMNKDVDQALEIAYALHLKSTTNAHDQMNQLYALRSLVLMLVLTGMPLPRYNIAVSTAGLEPQKKIKRHLEIAQTLLRASAEMDSIELAVAVVIEQSALCYLFAPRPFIRKYAFHLVLAGSRFGRSQQRMHAIRCYMSAFLVHGAAPWLNSHDHIQFTLARLQATIGNTEAALSLYVKLLHNCQQSPDKQEKVLQTFGNCYAGWAAELESKQLTQQITALPSPGSLLTVSDGLAQILRSTSESRSPVLSVTLPIVNDAKLKVLFDDEQQSNLFVSASSDDSDLPWQAIEACACALVHNEGKAAAVGGTVGNVFGTGGAAFSNYAQSKRARAVAQEPVAVEFSVTNSLSCPLVLSGVQLVCQMQSADGSVPAGVAGDAPPGMTFRDLAGHSVQVMALSLGPQETKDVTLTVVPRVSGTLDILGLRWHVQAGSVPVSAFHLFATMGKRLNSTREHRKQTAYDSPPNRSISVLSAMARLSVSMTPLPDVMLQGEVCRVDVTVTNKGSDTLDRLRLFATRSSYLHLGTVASHHSAPQPAIPHPEPETEAEALAQHNPAVTFDRGAVRVCSTSDPNAVRHLPFSLGCLQPGESVSFPMWLRSHRDGDFDVKILFFYKPHSVKQSSERLDLHLDQRFVRVPWRVRVLPLLSAKPAIYRIEGASERHLMALQIRNSSGTHELAIDSVCIMSRWWRIFDVHDAPVDTRLFARQNLLRVIKLERRPEPDVQQTNVQTMSYVGSPPLTDQFPYIAFLQHDKESAGVVSKRPPGQGRSGNVDVVITWSCRDKENPKLGQLNLGNVVLITEPNVPKQVHITGQGQPKQRIMSPRPSLPAVVDRGCHPLHVAFSHGSRMTVSHSFSARKTCVVAVSLCATNSSSHHPLTFQLEAHNTGMGTDGSRVALASDAASPPNQMGFMWVGPTRRTVRDLGPGLTVNMPLNVCFFAPGLYDISQFSIMVAMANMVPQLFKGECHALVNVLDVQL